MSTISVIVPVHNEVRYLGQTLDSLADQSRLPDELIIVDDASEDGSLDIALDFANNCSDRVQITVISDHFSNGSRARNAGASVARGDRLMFLDADDVLSRDTLEALALRLDTWTSAVAACPWFRLELIDGLWVKRPPSCRPRPDGSDPLSAWLSGWYHPTSSVMWTRTAFDGCGRWDERCLSSQDGDLMMRALLEGTSFLMAQGGACFYRRRPQAEGSVSAERFSQAGLASRIYVLEKIDHRLQDEVDRNKYAAPLADAAVELAAMAGRSHPIEARRARALARRIAPMRGTLLWVARRTGPRRARRLLRRHAWSGRLVEARPFQSTRTSAPGTPARVSKESGNSTSLDHRDTRASRNRVTDETVGSQGIVQPSPVPRLTTVEVAAEKAHVGSEVRGWRNPDLQRVVVRRARSDIGSLDARDGQGLKVISLGATATGPIAWRRGLEAADGALIHIGALPRGADASMGSLVGELEAIELLGLLLPSHDRVPRSLRGAILRREVLATVGFPTDVDDASRVADFLRRVEHFFRIVVRSDLTIQPVIEVPPGERA